MAVGKRSKSGFRCGYEGQQIYVEQEALIAFVTMWQGATKPTESFINRAKHNSQTLQLAGGERYLYGKAAGVTMRKGEIKIKIKEYLAMHVVQRCDQDRFSNLQKS